MLLAWVPGRPFLARAWAVFLPTLVAALLLAGPRPVSSQTAKTLNIAILTAAMVPWHDTTEGFRNGLRDFGLVEGRTVTFDVRAVHGDLTRVAEAAQQLVHRHPDLLFCVSDACQRVSTQIPIVFSQVSDPVRVGLVESIAHPGGNVTGIADLQAELTAKRLELLKAAVPSLRRVLVTYDPRKPEERDAVSLVGPAARQLGLTVLERPIADRLEIEPGLAMLQEGGHDGILIVAGTNLNIAGRSLEVATVNNLPTMYPASFWTTVGALLSYGPDRYAQGRQAARLAWRILTGTPPRELPVELPERIEFVVNLKTAKRLGIRVPEAVLFRADRVIQ